jgi:hypothetical protein
VHDGHAAKNGRSLLGREIGAADIPELAKTLGTELVQSIDITELASVVIRTGKPMPFPSVEQLFLKRSLVNGSQRLELTGWTAERLDWYKAKGCFTEIIRYQTRLFVAHDNAHEVLAKLEPAAS